MLCICCVLGVIVYFSFFFQLQEKRKGKVSRSDEIIIEYNNIKIIYCIVMLYLVGNLVVKRGATTSWRKMKANADNNKKK